jgi:hypothetical protein
MGLHIVALIVVVTDLRCAADLGCADVRMCLDIVALIVVVTDLRCAADLGCADIRMCLDIVALILTDVLANVGLADVRAVVLMTLYVLLFVDPILWPLFHLNASCSNS